jgi:hypothetical protein
MAAEYPANWLTSDERVVRGVPPRTAAFVGLIG